MEICGYTFTTQTTSIWKGYWTVILEFISVFTLIMSFLIWRCNLGNNHRAISSESWKEIRNRRVKNDFEKDGTLPAKFPLSHPSLSLALSYGNSLPRALILFFLLWGQFNGFVHSHQTCTLFYERQKKKVVFWTWVAVLEYHFCFLFQSIVMYLGLFLFWCFSQVLMLITTSCLLKFPSDFNMIHSHSLSVQHW